jgi:hypothetical protein
MAYPLSQFDGKMKTKDWKKVPSLPLPGPAGSEQIQWVVPEAFFDQLPEVLSKVPPLPGEDAIYTMIRSVLDVASKDPQVKQILKDTAVASQKELITPLFQWRFNGPPAGNGWYSPKNNGAFGVDYPCVRPSSSRTCSRTSSTRRSMCSPTTTPTATH